MPPLAPLRKPRIRILAWERKFLALQQVLFLYALVHEFLEVVIEGDEAYTKVQKNVLQISHAVDHIAYGPSQSIHLGLDCGKKDRKLFHKAIKTLDKIARQTHDLSIFTDGERRYGNLLFEIYVMNLYTMENQDAPRRHSKEGCTSESRIKVHKHIKKGRKRPQISAAPEGTS